MSDYTPRHMKDTAPIIGADLTPRRLAWLTPQVRSYLYGIILAVITLLGGYGLITDSMLPLWISLASAILGTTTALLHRPTNE